MNHIGIRIKERRELLGWTQDELAEKVGYKSRTTISKIEKGQSDVYQANIVKFSEVLGVSIAYLMGWDEDELSEAEALQEESLQGIEIVKNKKQFVKNKVTWMREVGTMDFTDDEALQIMKFAKYIVSQRKS